MTNQFESILDECISALQAGVPMEEVLAEVPDYASEIRPMLYVATAVTDPNPVLIPNQQKATLRAKYMEQVVNLPPPLAPSLKEKAQAGFHIAQRRLTRRTVLSDLMTIMITALLTLIMTLLMLNYAALDTVPGDLLYRFKRTSEDIQLALSWSDSHQQTLMEQFNHRRLQEIDHLLQQGQANMVDFRGTLESQGNNLWIIEGYPVVLPDNVAIDGHPQVGSQVQVIGFLRTNRDLIADTITLIEP